MMLFVPQTILHKNVLILLDAPQSILWSQDNGDIFLLPPCSLPIQTRGAYGQCYGLFAVDEICTSNCNLWCPFNGSFYHNQTTVSI